MTADELAALVGRAAAELGFDACGVTDLSPTETAEALEEWLRRRYHGEMAYMARQAEARREPQRVWAGARSAVVVLHNYHQPSGNPGPGRGRIASYAAGDDYHSVVKERLSRLGDRLVAAAGGGRWRAYVDVGPLPERELARFAPQTLEPRFRARAGSEMPTLKEIVEMDEPAFDDVFGGTALERAGRCGLARNARVVLENMAATEGNRWPAS